MTQPLHITSRDNPLLTRLRKLAHDNAAYRKTGEVWLEGEHLCRAVVARGLTIAQAVVSEAAWADPATHTICVVLTSLPAQAMQPHPRDLAANAIAASAW